MLAAFNAAGPWQRDRGDRDIYDLSAEGVFTFLRKDLIGRAAAPVSARQKEANLFEEALCCRILFQQNVIVTLKRDKLRARDL